MVPVSSERITSKIPCYCGKYRKFLHLLLNSIRTWPDIFICTDAGNVHGSANLLSSSNGEYGLTDFENLGQILRHTADVRYSLHGNGQISLVTNYKFDLRAK